MENFHHTCWGLQLCDYWRFVLHVLLHWSGGCVAWLISILYSILIGPFWLPWKIRCQWCWTPVWSLSLSGMWCFLWISQSLRYLLNLLLELLISHSMTSRTAQRFVGFRLMIWLEMFRWSQHILVRFLDYELYGMQRHDYIDLLWLYGEYICWCRVCLMLLWFFFGTSASQFFNLHVTLVCHWCRVRDTFLDWPRCEAGPCWKLFIVYFLQ